MKDIKVIQIRDLSVVADFDSIDEAELWINNKNIPSNFIIKNN